jgi:hypothetical protein
MKLNLLSITLCTAMLCVVLLNACSSSSDQHNVLTDQEKSEGWALLFDGASTKGWHVYNRGNMPSAWSADSGRLVCNPHAKNVKHGDLVTDKEYSNYELTFEWKISKAGNSGVFLNVQESPEFGATFATGPEYQLLDDKNVEPDYIKDQTHKAAAIFGVIPNTSASAPKPGDWNQSRIVQKDGKVTYWLNGVQTLTADFKSDDWKKTVAASGMSRYPSFGVAVKGHIAVQDWTSGVSFRDIKIKEL